MNLTEEEFEGEECREDTLRGKFLTFSLGEEMFGIEIGYVIEIIGIQQISLLPEVPDYIRGIINLRGKVIPVMDMRCKFRMEETGYTDRTCIVVIEVTDFSVGLIVDHVAEVITIAEESIALPPNSRSGLQKHYISGIGKVGNDVKLLLDCKKLFFEDEKQILSVIN